MINDPIFYAAVIPAVILCGLGKGGFTGISVLAMPLIALVISPIRGASILLPILIVQDLVGVWAYRRNWDRRNLAILLPGACLGIGLGYVFAARVSDGAIALAVGAISVIFAVRRLIHDWQRRVPSPSRADVPGGLFWGAVSGFTSMIANAGAPPFQVYVIPQALAKDVFVGTTIVFFAVVNWIKVPVFLALGQFNREGLATSLVLFPLAAASTWAGVLLVRRVSAERFYKIIYLLLLAVGSKLVWDGMATLT
jgi:hypothetical protein